MVWSLQRELAEKNKELEKKSWAEMRHENAVAASTVTEEPKQTAHLADSPSSVKKPQTSDHYDASFRLRAEQPKVKEHPKSEDEPAPAPAEQLVLDRGSQCHDEEIPDGKPLSNKGDNCKCNVQ